MSTTATRRHPETTVRPIATTTSRPGGHSGSSRLRQALRRVFQPRPVTGFSKPLPPTNVPEHLSRDEIRDAQVRQFGFHSRLC